MQIAISLCTHCFSPTPFEIYRDRVWEGGRKSEHVAPDVGDALASLKMDFELMDDVGDGWKDQTSVSLSCRRTSCPRDVVTLRAQERRGMTLLSNSKRNGYPWHPSIPPVFYIAVLGIHVSVIRAIVGDEFSTTTDVPTLLIVIRPGKVTSNSKCWNVY